MKSALLVYITTADEDEARRIGRAVVEHQLAACANIVPAIRSIYRWEGEVVEDGEALLLLKTTSSALERLVQYVRELHSYSVPCITAMAIEGGNGDYLDWVAASVPLETETVDGSGASGEAATNNNE